MHSVLAANIKCTHYSLENINVDDLNSSTGSLNYQFQKEIKHNKLLPYADELDTESQVELSDIKANLGKAIMLRELYPGCYFWVVRLYRYLRYYGLKFTKEDHITFIKLLYEIITIPDIDPFYIHKFGVVLVLLLKKKEFITRADLQLPWRPLYEICLSVANNKEYLIRKTFHQSIAMRNTLNALLHNIKPYFTVESTQELLDELRPTLCPFDEKTMYKGFVLLENFLQTHLPPEYHSMGYELWFKEFMDLWETCHNGQQWEIHMMWLMARLAFYNIGYIDWQPYIPIMFTRFIRSLNLPVTFKGTLGHRCNKIETPSISLWIASVLGNGTSCQVYLDKFMKTIDSYLHPANSGRWSAKLKKLISRLPHYFALRLYRERYARPTWETPTPEQAKLTDKDVDAFVTTMLPVVMTLMFNKIADEDVVHALQYLATMRPNLVIPNVLERLYSNLDCLTEPLKLRSSMSCMIAVARQIVQGPRSKNEDYTFPEGPMHLMPLLFSSLPGIDPNDVEKCFVIFRLLCVYFSLVPIVDSSKASGITDEEERLLCESTASFEDFVLQFLEKVFAFIDSSSLEIVRLENLSGSGKSRLESRTELAMHEACLYILRQTSDTIFESALRKLLVFVTQRNFELKHAGQLAGDLCRTFSRINGKLTLRALLPILSETILDGINETEDVIKDENVDHHLLHLMLMLSKVVDTSGHYLLPYMDTLLNILDRALLLKSKEGNGFACNILHNVLKSLTTLHILDCGSDGRNYNDPDYPYIRDWGKSPEIDSVFIKWYVPGEEEMALAQKIFNRYLMPQLEKLEKYCEDQSTLSREELLTCTNIIQSILTSCENVLPVWDEPMLKLEDSVVNLETLKLNIGVKGTITMPDGSNVALHITKLMTKVQDTMLKYAEDDIKSLHNVVEIWCNLLLGKSRLRDVLDIRYKHFQLSKKLVEDRLRGTGEQLLMLVLERTSIQHGRRVQHQSDNLTETHKHIMLQLFTLATSRYANVRARSQNILLQAFYVFPFSYLIILPHVLEILGKNTEENHEAYKGVLYLITNSPDPFVTKRKWSMIKSLWPALVLSKTSSKLSIIQLRDLVLEVINKNFDTLSVSIEIPDRVVEAAYALWETYPSPSCQLPDKNEIKMGVQRLKQLGALNREAYIGLIDELLDSITEKNLHWRHRLFAMKLIREMANAHQEYPVNVLRFFLRALIHDSFDERKIAMHLVEYILDQQKRKHPKVVVDMSVINKYNSQKNDESNADNTKLSNSWLQYDYATRPLTEEQWNEARYIHKNNIGYYAWPKKIEVYAPTPEQPSLDPDRELTDHEKEVEIFFDDPQNVKKFMKYVSGEFKKGKERFYGTRCLFYKNLFRNHGITFLKHFIPHLRKLIVDKHACSRVCAAEMIGGLINGAKQWPFQMTVDMWNMILPILTTIFSNMTYEAFADWGACFSTALEDRDPNRYHWLLEYLVEESSKETESSLVECGRLYILQVALNKFSWRVPQIMERVLTYIENKITTSPFQILRERLGYLLIIVLEYNFQLDKGLSGQPMPKARHFLDVILPKLQQLATDIAKPINNEQNLSSQIANVNLSDNSNSVLLHNDERERLIRLFKSVCKWIIGSVSHAQHGVILEHYDIFPFICQMETYELDDELRRICVFSLALLSQALTLPKYMSKVLEAITKLSNNSSWSIRITCLAYLENLTFYNMGIVLGNESWVQCIKSIVVRLMEDPNVEVRIKAAEVVGGLLHCMCIPDPQNLLEEFKAKAETPLYKNNYRNSDQNNEAKMRKMNGLRIRHAGILGLCAFISAHPYNVPPYIPGIFELLAPHMNDPQPIPTTIRKTFGDFKRTHYDAWTHHARKFTTEQLSILQDLMVVPSHYA